MRTLFIAVALVLSPVAAQAQDAAEGENVFKKCRACHQVGETAKNVVGPQLNGLFGRKAGTVEGFNYSEVNKTSGVVWDDKIFANYIKDPRAAMPGNKMAFGGIKDEKEVADLTAYIRKFDAAGKSAN